MKFNDTEMDLVARRTRVAFWRGIAVGMFASGLIHLALNTSVHFTWH